MDWRGSIIAVVLAVQAAPVPAAETPSPAVQAAVQSYQAALADTRARHAALGAPRSVADELARMVDLDQAARTHIPFFDWKSLSAADREAIKSVWNDARALDASNVARLRELIPADGWFRNSRDGKQATSDAWLIVQHAEDHAFMRSVLARMEALVAEGEVSGPDYALLYDRVEKEEGRPQRYGSQITCVNGVYDVWTLEESERVDDLRKQVGLGPLAEYKKKFPQIGKPCG